MFTRLCFLLVTLFALTGCVLQSPEALFAEQQGELALAQLGQRFRAETFDKGQWTSDNSIGIFTPSGLHYVVSNEKDAKTMDLLFVALGHGRYVIQAQDEPGKPRAYMIADLGKAGVALRPLLCDELKTLPKAGESISFDGMDCTVKGAPDAAYFANLAKQIAPAKMRLVPVK